MLDHRCTLSLSLKGNSLHSSMKEFGLGVLNRPAVEVAESTVVVVNCAVLLYNQVLFRLVLWQRRAYNGSKVHCALLEL